MITVKARNGHIVRIVTSHVSLAGLDDGTLLYGLAECAGCGVIHAFTRDDPPAQNASDEDLVDHLHHHIRGVVEVFEEEACVPDTTSDEIYDWRDEAEGETQPTLPS